MGGHSPTRPRKRERERERASWWWSLEGSIVREDIKSPYQLINYLHADFPGLPLFLDFPEISTKIIIKIIV